MLALDRQPTTPTCVVCSVPEDKCFGPRDRRCREWKVDPQDPENELDYDVEHVVAERVNPRTKEKLWLVKWAVSEQEGEVYSYGVCERASSLDKYVAGCD